MISVLTKQQAYKLDKDTIESGHLTQEELMDNAGKAVAQFFCEKIKDPFNQKVVVVCGKGNNGGDGVIAHSYLKKYNVSSKIVFTEEKHGHSNLLKKYKIFKSDYTIYSDKINFNNFDWIIDGIFGIGLTRDLDVKYSDIIHKINQINQIISIDIPSGTYTNSTGNYHMVNSNHLLTFGYPKIGLYLNPVNAIHIVDIGLKKNNSKIKKITLFDVYSIIKSFKMKSSKHKYNKGYTGIIAGSDLYPGAPLLSSKAAEKTGSSYVELTPLIESKELENCIKAANPTIVFNIHLSQIPESILIGPGMIYPLTKFSSGKNLIKRLDNFLTVIDSGGFLSFDKIINYPKKSILTPHIGEFKRIFSLKDDTVIDIDLFKSIQKKIEEKIIILKSFNTFIITKDMIYIMDKGPSILAAAGTGDVLSGILVSLLSQGYSRLEASILGTYLHAEAANYYMNNISKDGMTASDLIDCIPLAFNKLRDNG